MKQYVCLSAERIDAERKKILITIKSRTEMKKNILKVAFVAAIALVSGINVFNSHKTENLSDVVLANVEALANDEFEGDRQQCYQVYTPADWFHADKVFVDCYTCTQNNGRNFETSRFCNKPM